MPPDVEPAQPQTTEQKTNNTMAKELHVLVSAVANPEVVVTLTTWKAA
jgi:hypothetical protein